MASRSCRRKSASGPDVWALQRVLHGGAVLEQPSPTISAAAARLEHLGLIKVRRTPFVRCANPRDPDYPPIVRQCPGRIWLRADEPSDVCPECQRHVDLHDPPKQRYDGLTVPIQGEGVMAYLAGAAREFGAPSRPEPGILRFRAEPVDVFLCVPELCHDEHRLRQDVAAVQPTVLVTLEPTGPYRVLAERWLVRTTLADLVAGRADLMQLLQAVAKQARPALVSSGSMPIYAGHVRPILSKSAEPQPIRRFILYITHDEARVAVNDSEPRDGVVIARRKARVQLLVLQILAKQFLRSLLSMTGQAPGPLSAGDVADRLQRITKEEREDVESVRKSINRLQDTVANRVKRTLGVPIGREDILQTVPWQGRADPYGYELNPRRVVIGHCAGLRI